MYRIGVDLGGTNIAVGVIDENYNIIGRGKAKTACPRPAEDIFADMCKCVKAAAEDAGISVSEIESIGIGTPGTVDKANGVISYANNLDFNNVPAVELMKKEFPDVTIRLENDANCAALGEALAGIGKGKSSFVAVTLGTGVGGGIVLDGKLLTGCNDAGGEIGHISIKFDGEQCNCGRIGCWERYASATALINQTKKAMEENKDSKMWELCGGDISKAGGRTAFDAMRLGDEAGTKVVDTYIEYIGIGATNVVNIFQPEVVCLGGGVSNQQEGLINPIKEYLDNEDYARHLMKRVTLKTATFRNDAGVIGAALLGVYNA